MSHLTRPAPHSSQRRLRRQRVVHRSRLGAAICCAALSVLAIVGSSTAASALTKGSGVLVGEEPQNFPLPRVYTLTGRVVIAYPCVQEAGTDAEEGRDGAESKANDDPYPVDCQFPYSDGTVLIRSRAATVVLATDPQGRFVTALPQGTYTVTIIHPAQYAPGPQPACASSTVAVPQIESFTVVCAPAIRTVHVVGSVTDYVHPCPEDADCADVLLPTDGYKVVFASPNLDVSSGVKDGRYGVDIRAGRYEVTVQRRNGSFCPGVRTVWLPDTPVFESNISCS